MVLLFLIFSHPLSAASFHPFHGWRTIETKHFSVHYHNTIEEAAQKSAQYLEEAYEKLTPKYEWKPWGKTQIVLTDNNDDSNGLTTTLPYNWILLRLVPPDPESSLNTYDDWLKVLITHEYTHVLHLDAYGGFWKPFHLLFGKVVAPAGVTPGWIKEGTATLEETLGTNGGRGRASYSEMLIRTAVLKNKFPTIDRADGVQWLWPSGQTQYIFGVKFLQYLKDRFGEEKLQAFHRKTQSSFFLFAVNKQAKKVFGKSFCQLWRDWQLDLKEKYRGWESKKKGAGFTELSPYLKGEDSFYLPTFSRDGKSLAYVSLNPRRAPQLIVKDVETGKTKIVSHKVPSQISFSPDGESLVFSTEGPYKRFYFYYDLYRIDLFAKKPAEKRLTWGERARDPDWSPDGKTILFAAGSKGTDELKTYDIASKKIAPFVSRAKPYTQFAQPRYSPDGSQIAALRFTEGKGWEICVAGADGKLIKKIPHEGLSVVSRPAWSADGRSIIYSSDEDGVSNLYTYDVATSIKKRLTNVETGVFQPAVAPDGTLLARSYNGEGFEVSRVGTGLWTMDHGPLTRGQREEQRKKNSKETSETISEKSIVHRPSSIVSSSPVQKYSPFHQSLFLPRYLAPGFFLLDNGLLASVMTGSSDPLRYHNWFGGATYRTDAKHLGYFGQYLYNRFTPVFGFGVNDFAVDFGTLGFTRTGNVYHFFEERRSFSTFASMPLGKGHNVSAGYFYEKRLPITNITAGEALDLNLDVFAGFNAGYFYGTAESTPASISPIEKGRTIRLAGTVTDHRVLANRNNEQRIVTGDYREYLPLGKRNVIAFKLAGGAAFADAIVPGTFSLGGSLGEGVLAGPVSNRSYNLRGLPISTLIRDRVLVSSLEYRLPLVSPQRGIGTRPFFLNDLHLAFFGDAGDAWDDRDVRTKDGVKDFFDDFLVSAGAEMRADFVIAHGLPVTGRLGYARVMVNRNRLGTLTDPFLKNQVKNGILILQFGTSF